MIFDELVRSYDRGRDEHNVFHDLQRRRVREVLFIGSLYDSFVMETDGVFIEQSYGEYYMLNLASVPRLNSVPDLASALDSARRSPPDMIIVMAGTDFAPAIGTASALGRECPGIPLLLLVVNNAVLASIEASGLELSGIDRIFVWNGYSKLFIGMIKYVEDLLNVDADASTGLVRTILLIEDSVRYWSRYLPLLYRVILRQTQALIEEEGGDEAFKLLRLRSRPKVLLASDFETARDIFERHETSLLAIIADLDFPRGGSVDPEAGFRFLEMARERLHDLPMILQSDDGEFRERAERWGVAFADKSSESIEHDLDGFLWDNLGFGPFLFRDGQGSVVAEARNMAEFVERISDVPSDVLIRHAERNHFSTWLTARGELRFARMLRPYHLEDFDSEAQLRSFIKGIVGEIGRKRSRDSVPAFDEEHFREEGSFTRLGAGSVGGKGRGLVFARSLIQNVDFSKYAGGLEVRIPRTAFIGIDEFERFLELNDLWSFAFYEAGPGEIIERFLASSLDSGLVERLRRFVLATDRPLAVRSSGLFEDMLMVPFSGIYETLLIPNCHESVEERLRQLCDAIRLVYASLFSEKARTYFEVARYQREEERMAVILQEVVGRRRGRWYYPHLSGTAQSHNYYPVSYLKPEDGLCVAALGLGSWVVDGGASHRFCPRYPKVDLVPPERMRESSQRSFRALDMQCLLPDLRSDEGGPVRELDLDEAEGDPRLSLLASTWDSENDRLVPGTSSRGLRFIDLSNILKHEALPFAKVMDILLEIGERAMDVPVELEYSLNLDESSGLPTLYLLQIKPLFRSENRVEVDLGTIEREECFIVSERSMGNGRDDSISHVLWVDPSTFDTAGTVAIAAEIEELDREMRRLERRYILAGPGRWGTRDHSLGVPVVFSQISQARVIVEADLPGFQVESSLGSHFFNNVTSMNIGYLSVSSGTRSFVDWAWLASSPALRRTPHCVLSCLPEPFDILMDGRSGKSVVLKRAGKKEVRAEEEGSGEGGRFQKPAD